MVTYVKVLRKRNFDQLEESTVVFSAYRKSFVYYKNGVYIKDFDGFLANYGNNFDLASGIFTAPEPGMYEFSFTIIHRVIITPNLTKERAPLQGLKLQVWKNDVMELSFYSYS